MFTLTAARSQRRSSPRARSRRRFNFTPRPRVVPSPINRYARAPGICTSSRAAGSIRVSHPVVRPGPGRVEITNIVIRRGRAHLSPDGLPAPPRARLDPRTAARRPTGADAARVDQCADRFCFTWALHVIVGGATLRRSRRRLSPVRSRGFPGRHVSVFVLPGHERENPRKPVRYVFLNSVLETYDGQSGL